MDPCCGVLSVLPLAGLLHNATADGKVDTPVLNYKRLSGMAITERRWD